MLRPRWLEISMAERLAYPAFFARTEMLFANPEIDIDYPWVLAAELPCLCEKMDSPNIECLPCRARDRMLRRREHFINHYPNAIANLKKGYV